jgi:polyisoprenyl-phosphate glycosyltransferase
MSKINKLITIAIPAYNEEDNLRELYLRLNNVCNSIENYSFEIIIFDNCSHDKTSEISLQFTKNDNRWNYIRFSKNFGFESSIEAALHFSNGDAIIYLVSDLQDPPEKIKEIINIWNETNCDVVYGIIKERNDSSFLKTIGARFAYKLIAYLTKSNIPENATDFRLISRNVIEELKEFPEKNRYLRGLVHWTGFNQKSFIYDRDPRKHGKSDANLIYCINFAISAIIAFSTFPLRLATIFGIISILISSFLIVLYLLINFFTSIGYDLSIFINPPDGYTTLIIAISFFGGVNALLLGVIGEYIGRIYTEVKSRPLWIVDRKIGKFNEFK